jgi:CRP-like cAMP-binding protein
LKRQYGSRQRGLTGTPSVFTKPASRAAKRQTRVDPSLLTPVVEDRRRRSTIVEASSLDQLFKMSPLVAAGSASEQNVIRNVFDRHRSQLRMLTLTETALPFDVGVLPPKHLYWVMAGSVRLFWLGEAGGEVTLFVYTVGDAFGELQCGLLDAPVPSLNLHAEAVVTRTQRSARLLEVGPSVMAELLQNEGLRLRLAQSALQRSLNLFGLARFRMLRETGLAIAHLCVAPSCGHDFKYHDDLSYEGTRLIVEKTATIEELRHLAGVCENTVRTWLTKLKRTGFIDRVSRRFQDTRITIVEPALLVEALESGRLDISA